MFTPIPQRTYSSHLVSRLVRRSLLLLLTLSLLAGPLSAQTEQEAKLAAAKKLFREGNQLLVERTKESLEEALLKFTEALGLFRSVSDATGEAFTRNAIGFIYDALGERQKALDYFMQALPLFRAIGDRRGEAMSLTNVGSVYGVLGEKRKALEYFTQALPLFGAVGDRRGEATTLNNVGLIYGELGEGQKALDYHAQALTLRRAVEDREGVATTLNNIGLVYKALGEKRKALDYFAQSLPLRRAAGDRGGEATTLNNIGAVYDDLGEKHKALEYYTQALPLFGAVGDREGEATTLNNIGKLYRDLGESQKAFDYFAQALRRIRAVGNRAGEARTLNNIGAVYDDLGEKQQALDYITQALPLLRSVEDRAGEALTLNGVGKVYADLGERQQALEYYTHALSLFRRIGDRAGEALALSNIGAVYGDLGETQKALDYFMQALPLRRAVGDRGGEAVTLNNIGKGYDDLGERQQALDYFTQALLLARAVGDRAGEADTLSNIAYHERERGNLREALARIEAALSIVESLRTEVVSQDLRASYFAMVQGYYRFNIDLLMRLHGQQPSAGHDGAALQVSERRRARSLLELLVEAGTDIRQGVDPKLVERERALQQRLNASAQRQTRLLSGPHTEAPAGAIAEEIESLTTELRQVAAQIRQTSPRYAAVTQPQPLTLREIQKQMLDADTLLLEYSLGEDRSYLWAVTPTAITSYELPGREEIEAAARQFYELLTTPPPQTTGTAPERRELGEGARRQASAQLAQAASQLSRMLLAPVAAQLGKKRLLVVGDGALQYIPFAALPSPTSGAGTAATTPLVAEHEIVNLPSASTLAVLRREAGARQIATKTLAVLADPVFERSDERLKTRTGRTGALDTGPDKCADESRGLGLAMAASARQSGVVDAGLCIPRLPGTRREAEEIVKLVPPAQHKVALDFAASRASATHPDLGQYRYVHFATHGFLNSQHPELSGIALSMFDERGEPQDGFLRAHEVYNLKLAAEVIVLSACQTGLGKEIRGEGLVGLTRGFMYAGSPRVVVSLWNVSDEATAELMTRFYRGMLVDKLRPAQALQAAQVSILREKRFESPYFWAAFTLQGEWR